MMTLAIFGLCVTCVNIGTALHVNTRLRSPQPSSTCIQVVNQCPLKHDVFLGSGKHILKDIWIGLGLITE